MDITYVKAVFGSLRKTRTRAVYRDDHDLILQLVGVKGLPVHFQAHFANSEYGTAIVMMGSDGEVTIPNTLLATGLPVYCWILVEQGISGAVRYSVQIPVRQKARPDGTVPPEQADIISQAISALNDAGTAAQEAADSAAQNAEYVAGVKDDLYGAIDRVGVLEEAKETTLEAAGNAEAWAVGNRSGSAVPSTDPAYHNNSKYYAEQAADNALIAKINFPNFNSYNLLPQIAQRTARNVTITPVEDGTYALSGTASATTSFQLYNVSNKLPKGIVPGETYRIKFSAPTGTNLRFYKYISGTVETQTFYQTTTDGEVTIPTDAEGLSIAFYIPNGTAFANSAMHAFILDTLTNKELESRCNELEAEISSKGSEYEILHPDMFTGGDSNKVQRCINRIAENGTGGIIIINRKFTLNSPIVCNLRTDSSEVVNNHVFITFIGIGENAGFEFAASNVAFQGNDNGSPYGGMRFKNINFTRPASGVGYGSAFTQLSGMIRSVFENCRFSGFRKVFDCTDNGIERNKLVQNLTCINCYFTDCADYVIDAYSVGDLRRASYVYAVNIISCICEKCKGLIKGSPTSGYSVWTNFNIEDCTIENCTGIPIVFGVGARSVNIKGNYFEKNDYEGENIHIDMSSLFGRNQSSPANVLGINIIGNVFVKGISRGDYIAHSTAIKIPAFEPWGEKQDPDMVHGVISGNVAEDVFIVYDSVIPFGNKRRWKIADNATYEPYNKEIFFDYTQKERNAFSKLVTGAEIIVQDSMDWFKAKALVLTFPYDANGYSYVTVTSEVDDVVYDSFTVEFEDFYGGTFDAISGKLTYVYDNTGEEPEIPDESYIEPHNIHTFSGENVISTTTGTMMFLYCQEPNAFIRELS